jgi:hypothetical protein
MLRGTLAGSSSQSGQGSKGEMGTRDARLRAAKGSRFNSPLVGDAGIYDSKAEYQRALKEAHLAAECRVDSLTVQKNVLHGLLSRVESLMDSQSLLLSLTALLPPLSTGDAVGVTSTSKSVGPVSVPSPLVLLTDAGLAVVCCFACRLLTGQLEVPCTATDTASQDSSLYEMATTTSSVMRRPEEIFYTLDEVITRPRPPTQQSSQSSSSACSASGGSLTNRSTLSPGPPLPDVLDLLCSLLSLLPRLCNEEEALRKASAVSTSFLSTSWRPSSATVSARDSSSTIPAPPKLSLPAQYLLDSGDSSDPLERLYGMMGAPLDRAGCAVLILVLYALLDQGVHLARRRATGDLMEIVADPFISNSAKFITRNALALAKNATSDAEACRLSDSSSERCSMLALYDVCERQALDTQDVTLAIGGLHLLSSLSEGTLLARRQASIAWTLLHTLHTQHASLSTHLLSQGPGSGRDTKEGDPERIPGTDDLWPHLASYVCPALSPSLDCALGELQQGGNAGFFVSSGSKASKSALSAFRLAVGMSAATSRNVDISFLAQSVSSFRMIWTAWWSAEAPESRVNGVVTLLLEIFRCHLLPPDIITPAGSAVKSGSIEKGKSGSKAPRTAPAATGGAHTRSRVSYATPASQDSSSFPALCSDTLDALFALAVGMFPALFLLARPQSSLEFPEGDEEREAGPYGSFVAVAKAFVWVLQQLEEVLEDGSQLHFTMRTSSLCVRITRAVLVCVEGAIVGVAAWRSSQVLPRTHRNASSTDRNTSDPVQRASRGHSDSEDSADDSSMSDSAPAGDPGSDPIEEDAEEDADLGSVEYLACMLDWSQVLAHRAIRYAEALKGRMLHPESGLQVPR